MSVLLPFLFLAVPGLGDGRSTGESKLQWRAPGVFEESLAPCSKIRRSRGSLCAIGAEAAYWLEGADSAHTARINPPEPGLVLLDATTWGKRSAELWRGGDGLLHVWADLGDGWRQRTLPLELQPAATPTVTRASAVLAASGDTLVVSAATTILRLERGSWTCVPLKFSGGTPNPPITRSLLVDRDLFLASGRLPTEELVVADFDSGRARCVNASLPDGAQSVLDLDLGPDGRVYVTCGVSPLSRGGQLLVRNGDSWQALLSSPVRPIEIVCGNALPVESPPPQERSLTYLALSFDAESRPCLLTAEDGILRQASDGTWSCITPGWWDPELSVCDLALEGTSAILASMRAGVLQLDLSTLEGRRLHLP